MRERDNDGSCSTENSRSHTTKRRESLPEAPGARQRFPHCQRDDEDRDLQGRKQEIRGYRKARNRRLEHSTERSRLGGPRRAQVHVLDGRGVDGEDCDECQNHVSAETESRKLNRCEATPRQKMTRKATKEHKYAECSITRCRLSRGRLRSSNTETTGGTANSSISSRPLKKPERLQQRKPRRGSLRERPKLDNKQGRRL